MSATAETGRSLRVTLTDTSEPHTGHRKVNGARDSVNGCSCWRPPAGSDPHSTVTALN